MPRPFGYWVPLSFREHSLLSISFHSAEERLLFSCLFLFVKSRKRFFSKVESGMTEEMMNPFLILVTHLLVSVLFTKRNLQPVSIFKYQYLTSHYYLFIVCNARVKIRLMGLVLQSLKRGYYLQMRLSVNHHISPLTFFEVLTISIVSLVTMCSPMSNWHIKILH